MAATLEATDRRRFTIARIIVSFCALITITGAYIADFNVTHLLNPRWPPHAHFHVAQTMLLATFLGACALVYSWWPDGTGSRLHTGILFASLYWFSNGAAILFPGTDWADPDRAGQGLILGFPAAAVIGVVQISLLVIAFLLSRWKRNM